MEKEKGGQIFLRYFLIASLAFPPSMMHTAEPDLGTYGAKPCGEFYIPNLYDHEEILHTLQPHFLVPNNDPELQNKYLNYGFQIAHPDNHGVIATITLLYHRDYGTMVSYGIGDYEFDLSGLYSELLGLNYGGHIRDSETLKANLIEVGVNLYSIESVDIKRHEKWHRYPGSEIACITADDGQQKPVFRISRGKHGIYSLDENECDTKGPLGITIIRCGYNKLITINPNKIFDVGTKDNPNNIFTHPPLSIEFPGDYPWDERFCGDSGDLCQARYYWYPYEVEY